MTHIVLLFICTIACLYGAYLVIKSRRRIEVVQKLPDVIWMQRLYIVKHALGHSSVDEISRIMGSDNYAQLAKKRNIIQSQLSRMGLTLEDAIDLRLRVSDTQTIASLNLGYNMMMVSAAITMVIFGIHTFG